MKIRVSYQKEIEVWIENFTNIPTNFSLYLSEVNNNIEASYKDFRLNWIENKIRKLNSDSEPECRNIQVDEKNSKITYEVFDTDYIDAEDVFEVETVKELISKMEKYDCNSFYKDDNKHWMIE